MRSAIASLARRVTSLLSRGAVTLANAADKMQVLQVSLLADEGKNNLEHFEPYGFTSHPLPGAEVLAAFLDGDRSHGVAVVAADRRYRIKNLQAGEVAIYDDLGHQIVLNRDGIHILGGNHQIRINGCPSVSVTNGDVVADGVSLKHHTHNGVAAGSASTGLPQ